MERMDLDKPVPVTHPQLLALLHAANEWPTVRIHAHDSEGWLLVACSNEGEDDSDQGVWLAADGGWHYGSPGETGHYPWRGSHA